MSTCTSMLLWSWVLYFLMFVQGNVGVYSSDCMQKLVQPWKPGATCICWNPASLLLFFEALMCRWARELPCPGWCKKISMRRKLGGGGLRFWWEMCDRTQQHAQLQMTACAENKLFFESLRGVICHLSCQVLICSIRGLFGAPPPPPLQSQMPENLKRCRGVRRLCRPGWTPRQDRVWPSHSKFIIKKILLDLQYMFGVRWWPLLWIRNWLYSRDG